MGTLLIFMMGGGEPGSSEELRTMDEFTVETINFETSGEVMVNDEETVYWPIHGPSNSTEVILVTGIQVLLTWSDDEQPPASRPMYQNTPDTMTLDVVASPYLQSLDSGANGTENSTVSKSSNADTGTTRVDLDMKSSPVLLETGSDGNVSFDPAGSSEHGSTGLYIGVTCLAGNIEASRPAVLMYTDRGDEVSLDVTISLKRVPQEVFEAWVQEQTQGPEW
jgi:hypothetical protein